MLTHTDKSHSIKQTSLYIFSRVISWFVWSLFFHLRKFPFNRLYTYFHAESKWVCREPPLYWDVSSESYFVESTSNVLLKTRERLEIKKRSVCTCQCENAFRPAYPPREPLSVLWWCIRENQTNVYLIIDRSFPVEPLCSIRGSALWGFTFTYSLC